MDVRELEDYTMTKTKTKKADHEVRWPNHLRVMTKAEKEFRRQQEYRKNGTKRETQWLKR